VNKLYKEVALVKVICKQDELARYLQVVVRGIATKATLPILTGIYLETQENYLKCIATDLELAIEVNIPNIQVIQPGAIVLPGKTFVDIIRHLPNNPLEIATNDDTSMVTIASQSSSYQLPVFPVTEYPLIAKADEEMINLTVDGEALKEAIRQTVYATLIDDPRPYLSSVLWEITSEKLRLVATDVNRLAIRDIKVQGSNSCTALVPVRALREIANIFGGTDKNGLKIGITDKNLQVVAFGITFTTRLIEAQFPRYEMVIPKDFKGELEIKRDQLIGALERTALVSNSIKFAVDVDKIVITAKEPDKGRSYEEMKAEINGINIDIGFNVRFLLDFLKTTDSETIVFKYLHEQKPALLSGKNEDEYQYIVMPLKLAV
jgi:DNA polymerase-3 subunit beta